MTAHKILKEWIEEQIKTKSLQSVLDEVIEYDYVIDGNCSAWEEFTLIFKVNDKHIAVDITKWHTDTSEKYYNRFFEKLNFAYFVEPYQVTITKYK